MLVIFISISVNFRHPIFYFLVFLWKSQIFFIINTQKNSKMLKITICSIS
eukprot:UN10917